MNALSWMWYYLTLIQDHISSSSGALADAFLAWIDTTLIRGWTYQLLVIHSTGKWLWSSLAWLWYLELKPLHFVILPLKHSHSPKSQWWIPVWRNSSSGYKQRFFLCLVSIRHRICVLHCSASHLPHCAIWSKVSLWKRKRDGEWPGEAGLLPLGEGLCPHTTVNNGTPLLVYRTYPKLAHCSRSGPQISFGWSYSTPPSAPTADRIE